MVTNTAVYDSFNESVITSPEIVSLAFWYLWTKIPESYPDPAGPAFNLKRLLGVLIWVVVTVDVVPLTVKLPAIVKFLIPDISLFESNINALLASATPIVVISV